jgi:hypothetical protein
MRKLILFTTLSATAGLALAVPAISADVGYPDFSSTAGLQLNGDAEQRGDRLRLVSNQSQSGSAFTQDEVIRTDRSFTSRFVINMGFRPVQPGDGMAFVIHPNGADSLGESGGGLGYAGIADSLAVEFDLFFNGEAGDPGQEHVGIMSEGNQASHLDVATPNFSLVGQKVHSWVRYNADRKRVLVFVNDENKKPRKPLAATAFDLEEVVGARKARAGFTAGTGSTAIKGNVLSWTLE